MKVHFFPFERIKANRSQWKRVKEYVLGTMAKLRKLDFTLHYLLAINRSR